MLINNKKFVYLCVILVIILSSISFYFMLNYKNLYMNIEYPMWDNVKKIINSKKDNDYNFITIGDSRAKVGFKSNLFDDNQINSINLSVGGGTPIEGYYTLFEYLKNNKKPLYILLSYGPFHLEQADCFWTRNVRFDFLKYDQLKDIISISKVIENDNTTLGNHEKLIDYKIKPYKYFKEFTTGLLERRWNTNKDIYSLLLNSKGHFYFGRQDYSNELNSEATKNSFIPSKVLNYYLEEIIKLAYINNIQVYYYTMPFNESSYLKMNKEYKSQYDNYINNLGFKYNMKILNNLDYLTNDNFGDPSHLYKGVEQVTLDIRNKFRNIENLEKVEISDENLHEIIKFNNQKFENLKQIFDLKQNNYFKNSHFELDFKNSDYNLNVINIDPVIILNETKTNSKKVILSYEINSEVDTTFQLFYKKENNSNYNEADSYKVPLKIGNNKINLLIPSKYINNNLRVDFVSNIGKYDLKEFKIYSK